ncbi:uncharacterized protein LOC135830628, partial [Sycon ciliatum]|uniref:uncharacterized protein LOC135830628 n=1 Tax=Sycon ciliatum TaxID=27933 RepID=UPI0031F6D3C4
MPKLDSLSLASNNIYSLPQDVFQNLKALGNLDISSNHLWELPLAIFNSQLPTMTLTATHNDIWGERLCPFSKYMTETFTGIEVDKRNFFRKELSATVCAQDCRRGSITTPDLHICPNQLCRGLVANYTCPGGLFQSVPSCHSTKYAMLPAHAMGVWPTKAFDTCSELGLALPQLEDKACVLASIPGSAFSPTGASMLWILDSKGAPAMVDRQGMWHKLSYSAADKALPICIGDFQGDCPGIILKPAFKFGKVMSITSYQWASKQCTGTFPRGNSLPGCYLTYFQRLAKFVGLPHLTVWAKKYGSKQRYFSTSNGLTSRLDHSSGLSHAVICVEMKCSNAYSNKVYTCSGVRLRLLPDNIDPAVEKLNFTSNSLTSVPGNFLQSFAQLLEIDFSVNKLTTFEATLFEKNVLLERLNVSFNALTSIPSSLFKNQINLQTLDISDNQLDQLPVELLRDAKDLNVFNASRNLITQLPAEMFQSNRVLKHIALAHNLLKQLPLAIFRYNTELRTIKLYGNDFTKDSHLCSLEKFASLIVKLEVKIKKYLQLIDGKCDTDCRHAPR